MDSVHQDRLQAPLSSISYVASRSGPLPVPSISPSRSPSVPGVASPVPGLPPSPSSHCQTKRVRLTPISDHISPQNSVCDQGDGFVVNPRPTNLKETSGVQDLSRMSATMTAQTSSDANDGNGHLLDSKIIQSRFTEEEMAADPILGVANWLDCPPSALTMRGALSSPAPKYHSNKVGDGQQNLNEVLSGPEIPQKLREDGIEEKPTSSYPTLYVWDLDETLIIFQTLRNGRYAELFKGSKDPREACELGRRWESLILDICDDYFFYKQVEDYNEPSLLSLQDFDDGADLSHYNFENDHLTVPVDAANKKKLAYRHRVVGDLYAKGLETLLTHDQLTEWNNLYEATDVFTDGWLTAGRELLKECQKANQQKNENHPGLHPGLTGRRADSIRRIDCDPILKAETFVSNYNILVTSGTLVPSLVKCLLFRLDKFFHHFNIYSSQELGKLQCFRWIKERVQDLPFRYCVIGDGIDESEAAHDLSWPFVKINIGPYAIHRLPTVTMDILNHYMNIIYDPPDAHHKVT